MQAVPLVNAGTGRNLEQVSEGRNLEQVSEAGILSSLRVSAPGFRLSPGATPGDSRIGGDWPGIAPGDVWCFRRNSPAGKNFPRARVSEPKNRKISNNPNHIKSLPNRYQIHTGGYWGVPK